MGETVGFKAVYSSEDRTNRVVEMKPPVMIMDRDLEHRRAYPLTISFADETDERVTVIYLDEDLRVVREDNLCIRQMVEGECTHAQASFERQGALPDHALPNEESWLSVPGEYRYSTDAQLPYRITHKADARTWKQVSYEETEVLPRAEVWPKSTDRPDQNERTYRMFPGEHDDPYGRDSPPQEALEWLLANNEEANRLFADGCVQRYQYRLPLPEPEPEGTALPLPPP